MVIPSNINHHSKEETNNTVRRRAPGVGGRIQEGIRPRISCALSCHPSKSKKLSNEEVSRKLDVAETSVFNWTKRYAAEGISGLKTKTGQGRKPIMDCTDVALVRKAVSQERQSVKAAKNNLWEASSGKKASEITFKRFLEVLAHDISISQNAKG